MQRNTRLSADELLFEGFIRQMLMEAGGGQTFQQWLTKNQKMVEKYEDPNRPMTAEKLQKLDARYDPEYSVANEDQVGSPNYLMWIVKNKNGLEGLGETNSFCAREGSGDAWGKFYIDALGKQGKMIKDLMKDKNPNVSTNINDYTASSLASLIAPIYDTLRGGSVQKKFKKLKRFYSPEDIDMERRYFNSQQDAYEKKANEEGTPFERREFKEPEVSAGGYDGYDYRIVYQDDEWVVFLPLSHQGSPDAIKQGKSQDECGEQFIGQMGRKDEVMSLFPKGMGGKVDYTKPEWCTVAKANYNGYWKDYGGWNHRILICVPKVNGQIDFMSPFKVQCDDNGGHGSFKNIRDIGGTPYSAFKRDWTDGLFDFFASYGQFHTTQREVCSPNAEVRMDIVDGKVVTQSTANSIVPRFKRSIESETGKIFRYAEIKEDKGVLIGRELKTSDGLRATFKILNPTNGDPMVDYNFLSIYRSVDDEFSNCKYVIARTEGYSNILFRLDKSSFSLDEVGEVDTVEPWRAGDGSGSLVKMENGHSFIISSYGIEEVDGQIFQFSKTQYIKVTDDGMGHLLTYNSQDKQGVPVPFPRLYVLRFPMPDGRGGMNLQRICGIGIGINSEKDNPSMILTTTGQKCDYMTFKNMVGKISRAYGNSDDFYFKISPLYNR